MMSVIDLKRKREHRAALQQQRSQARRERVSRPVEPVLTYEPGYAAFLRRVADVEMGDENDIKDLTSLEN